MGLNFKNRRRTGSAVCAAVLLVCLGVATTASSNAVVPDDQKALLTVMGRGATPYAQISLSTGPQQTIVTKADRDGQFLFTNLKYASFSDLKFNLDIPPYTKGLATNYPANHLEFKYNAKESMANLSGQIGQYGTLAFNLTGSDNGMMRFSGAEGYVTLQSRTANQMASGQSSMTASIINAGEVCCPKMIVPAAPITLTILSQPFASEPPAVVVPQKKDVSIPSIIRPLPPKEPASQPASQGQAPVQSLDNEKPAANPTPYILVPKKDKDTPQEQKPKVPYIIQGRIDVEPTTIVSEEVVAATSFTNADFDATYVGGVKSGTDSDRNTMMMAIETLGAFFDVRDLLDTTRSLQMSTAQTLRNYTTSDAVCRFGTLSKSVASASSVARSNQMAFSKIMMDRTSQKEGTVFSDAGRGTVGMLNNFKDKYCSKKDNNTFLEDYCKAATATSDLLYDRDVDFTRVFDIPLTLDADFTDNAMTNDKQSVIALFNNLSLVPPLMSSTSTDWDPSNSLQTQDIRSLEAMRTVSANSFAALVGQKAKSTAQATSYMKEMIQQLGLDATAADKLLGANPSYFAQMEVLTKKLFQNPAFYANLYDSEANIDRQRVAMKAIELQQDRDFLESLRRREMALSVLVNAKLRSSTDKADESGYVTQGKK
jgi:hypothetical protein